MTLRWIGVTSLAVAIIWGSPARADIVTEWNETTLAATPAPSFSSPPQSRVVAMVHAAIYDALRGFDAQSRSPAFIVDATPPPGASLEAAVSSAAHGVLAKLVNPAQRPLVDGALQRALARLPDDPARAAGLKHGAEIADKLLAARADDKSAATVAFTPKADPGHYQFTGPTQTTAALTQWGGVKPFAIKSLDKFTFKGPPALNSAAFIKDFEEVKRKGARISKERTADETAAAVFWVIQTAVPWNAAARAASAERKLSIADNAKLFAMLGAATADSQIACFVEKYKRSFWRPVTAIRGAAALKDARLKAEPNWQPLLNTPPHPDYPSAHACFSGAAEAVLKAFFGTDKVAVDITYAPASLTRSYKSFSQITREVDGARVWGGIHFRSADRDGSDTGRRIGAAVAASFPRLVE